MNRIFCLVPFTIAASLALLSCEYRRDSHFNEQRNKAAADSNTDKFDGKRQKDADFVFNAISALYGEIKLEELAIQRSHTAEVKEIANKFQADHSAFLNELKTLAQHKAISVPVEEKEGIKRIIERIADESGRKFDERWHQEMLDMHKESIGRFEKRLEDTDDVSLKNFIETKLPVLKAHYESLKRYKEVLGIGN